MHCMSDINLFSFDQSISGQKQCDYKQIQMDVPKSCAAPIEYANCMQNLRKLTFSTLRLHGWFGIQSTNLIGAVYELRIYT